MSIWERKKEKLSPYYVVVKPGNSTLDKWALGKEFNVYIFTTIDRIINTYIHYYAQADHFMI